MPACTASTIIARNGCSDRVEHFHISTPQAAAACLPAGRAGDGRIASKPSMFNLVSDCQFSKNEPSPFLCLPRSPRPCRDPPPGPRAGLPGSSLEPLLATRDPLQPSGLEPLPHCCFVTISYRRCMFNGLRPVNSGLQTLPRPTEKPRTGAASGPRAAGRLRRRDSRTSGPGALLRQAGAHADAAPHAAPMLRRL